MDTFLQHNKLIDNIQSNILEYAIIAESKEDVLTEGVIEEGMDTRLLTLLKKSGLHLHKSKGLIQYIAGATKGIGKLFMAAIRKDKVAVQEIIKSVKKEDVIDFLLKLDQATLHVVTGPIHLIDSITGWHLWAAVAEKAVDAIKSIQNAFKTIKRTLSKIISDKSKHSNAIKTIEKFESQLLPS